HQPTVGQEASAGRRGQLLAEIEGLTTPDDMAAWAQRALAIKNGLQDPEAAMVERAFTARLEQLTHAEEIAENRSVNWGAAGKRAKSTPPAEGHGDAGPTAPGVSAGLVSANADMATPASDCADLAFGRTRRKRDKDHRAFVASKACLVCGRQPADAHHLRFAQPAALGRKVSHA